jgi:voltage-gated potassium channel
METLRQRVNSTLQIKIKSKHEGLSFAINIGITTLIFLNTIAIILHTIPKLRANHNQLFQDFEVFSVIVFSIEYVLRVWSIVEQPEYAHPIKGRLKFIFSAWGIIDFLSIFPFYFSLFTTDLGFVRVLRLLRMLRLFRVSRYFRAITEIQKVLINKKEELVLSFSFIFFLLFILSSLVYFIEHEAQPKVFVSIPAALWWGVNNMTTVGYGDIIPITPLGKIISGILSILGVSSFALPTGILASGFAEYVETKKGIKCPKCGENFHIHKT